MDRSYFFSENPVMECYCCKYVKSFRLMNSVPSTGSNHLFYQSDLCFMASRVITGEAKAIVIRTGDRTFWGYLCMYRRKDSFLYIVFSKRFDQKGILT